MKAIKDQTILITGSTDGIGKIAAIKLAAGGGRVLLHGRNQEKLNAVAEEIRSTSNNLAVEAYLADFSSLSDVRKLADEVIVKHERLDILINNAGIGYGENRQQSGDGYELRFAVNYLAAFLLTQLLLPALRNAAPARIVNVSSGGQHPVDFSNLMLEKEYGSRRAYNQSKLALIMFTIELAEKLRNEGITVNSLHPGTYLDTKMVKEAGIQPWGKVETGAEAEIYLATSADLEGVTGQFYDQKSPAKALPQAYDSEARKRLWKLSHELTGLTAS